MTSKKKILLISLVGVLFLILFGVLQWQIPKVESLAKYYINSISKDEKIPIKISAEAIEVGFFPPRLILKGMDITPKPSLADTVKPFSVQFIEIEPSLIDLSIGKFWISSLLVKGSDIQLHIAESKGKSKTSVDFTSILKLIPISEIQVQNIKVQANIENKFLIKSENLFVRAYNQKNSLLAKIKDPSFSIKKEGEKESIGFLLDTQFMLTKNSLSLSKLKIIKEKSFFIASGNINYKDKPSNIRELRLNTRVKSSFKKLDEWSNYFHKNDHLKMFKGEAKVDMNLYKKSGKDFAADVSGHMRAFQIEKILLGDIDFEGSIKDRQTALFPKISINLAGNNPALITDLQVQKKDSLSLSADLQINDAQLHSFLKESHIADIPVWVKIKGKLKCSGGVKEKFELHCPGAMTAKDVVIKNKDRSKNIVTLKEADAEGSITVSEKDIKYTAKIKTEHSKGGSKGVIDYDKGFTIDYDSPLFDLADVKEIAELGFAGKAPLKGQTTGNSRTATFYIDFQAENFEFTDYYFGNLQSKLRYKKGTLYFENLNGSIESTRYNGYLNVDLLKDRIVGDISLPFFRMTDIQQSVIKKVDLGGRFLGSGSGKAHIDTSFDTDKLNFAFKGVLFKGTAFGESYDEAKVQIRSTEGLINLRNTKLMREKSIFSIDGTMDMGLNTNFSFKVENGNLQNSLLLKKMKIPISGTFTSKGKITKKLSSPKITAQAEIKDFTFNKKKYGPATFKYKGEEDTSLIDFSIPEQLELSTSIPKDLGSTYKVDLETNKLDIAPIIGYAIAEDSTRSYHIESSGQASGYIDFSQPWNSEFSALLKELSVDYKGNRITSQLPTSIELKKHKLFLNEFNMKGDKQFLKVNQPYTRPFETGFSINGRINISFFKLFAPFIERIDGFSTLHLELDLKKDDFKLIGSSYTSNSYILFPKFPHAFENVTADVLFNQNKLLINSIKGRFADGTAFGNGELLFRGPKDYDLNINLNFEKINIRFPEDFSTEGNAQMNFSGSGVPFKLKGQYVIEKGLVEKEFTSQSNDDTSNLLTELLKKEEASPIILDIDVDASQSVQVRNTLIDGDIAGKFKVYDKVDLPRIKGNAQFLRDSKIKFRDTEFEVIDSNFQFTGNYPVNPNILLNSKTRLRNYDITMLLQGSASNPKLNLSSQPALTEKKIISLLAFGVASDSISDDPNSQTNLQVGTSLLGNNPLGNELKNRTGFDIQFSSSFDSSSNVAVPRVTLSRQFSKKTELSISHKTGNAQQSEARVRHELTDQFSTIFSARSKNLDTLNDNTQTINNNNEQLGIDVEYQFEFD